MEMESFKNENIFISYNTYMNYNDIYSKTITTAYVALIVRVKKTLA